jgi:hypothetical protein
MEDILEYLAQVGDSSDDYGIRLDDVLASDERIVLFCQVSTRAGERVLDVPFVVIAQVRDGKIVEVWSLPMDPEAVRTFWAE